LSYLRLPIWNRRKLPWRLRWRLFLLEETKHCALLLMANVRAKRTSQRSWRRSA
jgi:hypothetical protein